MTARIKPMSNYARALAVYVHCFRRMKNMTMIQLAEASGVDVSTIHKIENFICDTKWSTACMVARGLGVSVSVLSDSKWRGEVLFHLLNPVDEVFFRGAMGACENALMVQQKGVDEDLMKIGWRIERAFQTVIE